jgi:hypothetical protein
VLTHPLIISQGFLLDDGTAPKDALPLFIKGNRASSSTFLSFSAKRLTIIFFVLDTLVLGRHLGAALYHQMRDFLCAYTIDYLCIPFNFPDTDDSYVEDLQAKFTRLIEPIMR